MPWPTAWRGAPRNGRPSLDDAGGFLPFWRDFLIRVLRVVGIILSNEGLLNNFLSLALGVQLKMRL